MISYILSFYCINSKDEEVNVGDNDGVIFFCHYKGLKIVKEWFGGLKTFVSFIYQEK